MECCGFVQYGVEELLYLFLGALDVEIWAIWDRFGSRLFLDFGDEIYDVLFLLLFFHCLIDHKFLIRADFRLFRVIRKRIFPFLDILLTKMSFLTFFLS